MLDYHLIAHLLIDPDPGAWLVLADHFEENARQDWADYLRCRHEREALPSCPSLGDGPIRCDCPWHVVARRERLLAHQVGLPGPRL